MIKSIKSKSCKASANKATKTGATKLNGAKAGKPRPTKNALLLKHLKSRKGATQQQLSDEFGWQPHTVRAAISRLRTAGFDVTRGRGKDALYYRIAT